MAELVPAEFPHQGHSPVPQGWTGHPEATLTAPLTLFFSATSNLRKKSPPSPQNFGRKAPFPRHGPWTIGAGTRGTECSLAVTAHREQEPSPAPAARGPPHQCHFSVPPQPAKGHCLTGETCMKMKCCIMGVVK